MKLYFRDLKPYVIQMFRGLGLSISLTLVAMLVGSILGLLLYLGKSGRQTALKAMCSVYIEIMRNTPLLVQLYLIYFGLAQIGIDVSAFTATLVAMILNNAAYTAEIFRGGFLSVPNGLVETGYVLGMTPAQVFLIVRLKPALKSAFPALINQFIMLFLFSSVASIIALPELTYVAMNTASATARTFEVYLVTGVLYYVSCFIAVSLMRYVEKRVFNWRG